MWFRWANGARRSEDYGLGSRSPVVASASTSAPEKSAPVPGRCEDDYSTAYPSARALSLTRAWRVTIVTSWGGSPSNSAVARCTASSVRIGSTGNGRRTRERTASVTATTSHRRSNTCSPLTAARSSSGVRPPVARARMIARAASARVSAEVTRRPLVRSANIAEMSWSSRAATRPLDSIYRRLATAATAAEAPVRRTVRRAELARLALRFATVGVDQLCGGPSREPNVWPLLEWIASLERRPDDTCRDQLLVPTRASGSRPLNRRNKLRHDAAVRRHGDAFARLNPSYVATQIVLQFADACRRHVLNIATCGHICNGRFVACWLPCAAERWPSSPPKRPQRRPTQTHVHAEQDHPLLSPT